MTKCGKRYLFSSEGLVKGLCYVNVPCGCIIDMGSEINSALRMEPMQTSFPAVITSHNDD